MYVHTGGKYRKLYKRADGSHYYVKDGVRHTRRSNQKVHPHPRSRKSHDISDYYRLKGGISNLIRTVDEGFDYMTSESNKNLVEALAHSMYWEPGPGVPWVKYYKSIYDHDLSPDDQDRVNRVSSKTGRISWFNPRGIVELFDLD
jgi:hypothetical protein